MTFEVDSRHSCSFHCCNCSFSAVVGRDKAMILIMIRIVITRIIIRIIKILLTTIIIILIEFDKNINTFWRMVR